MWSSTRTDTVTAVLARAVDESPDKVYLDFSGETYTYAQVWDRSLERAGALAGLGLCRGDTLVCMLDNNLDASSPGLRRTSLARFGFR